MLRLIFKSAIFLTFVVGIGIVAMLFSRNPGTVQITWGNWIIELQAATLAVTVAGVFLGAWMMASAVRFLMRAPSALEQHLQARRQRRGLDALAEAILAAVAGNPQSALTAGRKAERLLHDPKLTRPLMARVLAQSGKEAEAKRYFQALADRPKTVTAGIRGLVEIAERAGDHPAVLRHAQTAVRLRPRDPWALGVLFDSQARAQKWSSARNTLKSLLRVKALDKATARQREAVLHTAEAMAMEKLGNSKHACTAALNAVTIDHGHGPAASIAGRLLLQAGDRRQAERILRRAWRAAPVPEIAATWAAIAPEEDARARGKRFARLTDTNPTHIESRLLTAELAIAQRDFAAARNALGELPQQELSARICAIMAAIEKGGNDNDAAARSWLTRALSSPRGRGWSCTACGIVQDQWRPLCPDCNDFNTIQYGTINLGGSQVDGLGMTHVAHSLPEAPAKVERPQSIAEVPSSTPPRTPTGGDAGDSTNPVDVIRPDA